MNVIELENPAIYVLRRKMEIPDELLHVDQ